MDKLAYHAGIALAFHDAGYSPESIKEAFIQHGMHAAEAAHAVKEAGWLSAAAPALRAGSKAIFGATRGASKAVGPGRIANTINRMGGSVGAGMNRFARKPLKTTWGFGKNLAQGGLMLQGKGVGGTVGKGLFATSMLGG